MQREGEDKTINITQIEEKNVSLVHASLSQRNGFIRKVYTILSLQLIITFAVTALIIRNEEAIEFVLSYIIFLILAVVMAFAIGIAILCCNAGRMFPYGHLLLLLFTLCLSYTVAVVCADLVVLNEKGYQIINMTLIMTVAITITLTFIACTTKEDFTNCYTYLFLLVVCMFLFGLFIMYTDNRPLHILYCVLMILLYSFYLIVDTQLIIGGIRYELSVDDYIIGAMLLYIDIIILFFEILKLLSSKDKD